MSRLTIAATILFLVWPASAGQPAWTVTIVAGSETVETLACHRTPGNKLECVDLAQVLDLQLKTIREADAEALKQMLKGAQQL